MGRKKRKLNVELKPFCYYCDREFDDEKVLIQHQKAKHFKCTQCNRKLDLASGLVVHMMQVHKTNLKAVPNALPKRSDPELIIRGMSGVPTELIEENVNKIKEEIGEKIMKRQANNQWAHQQKENARLEAFMQQVNPNVYPYSLYNSYPLKNIPNQVFNGSNYINNSDEMNKGIQNTKTLNSNNNNINTLSFPENPNVIPLGNQSSNAMPNSNESFLNPREPTKGMMTVTASHANNLPPHLLYLQKGMNPQTNTNVNVMKIDPSGISMTSSTIGNHSQPYQSSGNDKNNLLSFGNTVTPTHPLQHIHNALYNSDQVKKDQNEKAIENKNSKMNDIKSTIKNNILMHKQNLLGKVLNQNINKKNSKDMIFEDNNKKEEEEGKEEENENEKEKEKEMKTNHTTFSKKENNLNNKFFKESKENEKEIETETKQDHSNDTSQYTYTNLVIKKVKLDIPPPDTESISIANTTIGNVKLHYNDEIPVNQMKAIKEFNWDEDETFKNRIVT